MRSSNPTVAPFSPLWTDRREAGLNWLALGLLLAAWNAADDTESRCSAGRPESLRGYSCVSVRAATRGNGHGAVNIL
jgi:hypothetical protein